MDSIGDAWSFSSKTSIILSGGFSVETLTGVTLSWKTELNRSIPAVKDGIPRGLQYCHKICCKKGGRYGRQACMCLEMTLPQGCNFQMDRLAYDNYMIHKKI